jgi:hypothetical protein
LQHQAEGGSNVIVVLGIVLVYMGVCAVAGFRPVGTLDSFEPAVEPELRRFRDHPAKVYEAFAAAVARTPGMLLADRRPDTLYVDLRPTTRIMDGNFGLAIRLVVAAAEGGGATVRVDWSKKVAFSFSNDSAAFSHAERALRMNAKAFGLDEVLEGVDSGLAPRRRAADDLAPVRRPERAVAVRPQQRAVVGPAPLAGWYPDPAGSGGQRYWDGGRWTEHVEARTAAPQRGHAR